MSSFTTPVLLTHCQHLAVFCASGADTTTFLQSQLTQDIGLVSPTQSALAGFCTAQGRLWATMLLTQAEQSQDQNQTQSQPQGLTMVGVAAADVMETFLKRLRMFVMRSKVTITASAELKVYGVQLAAGDFGSFASQFTGDIAQEPWASATTPDGTWLKLPSANSDVVRLLWLTAPAHFDQLIATLGNQAQLLPAPAAWQIQDIQAGLPWVEAASQDLFIGQTLNLDLIGGVSFTKGCYPGQEVIARAHYRGTVKRRMHLATIKADESDVSPGMDIFDANEPDNPVGRLINVADDPTVTGQIWALFEAPFKALSGSPLRAGSATGPELIELSLPYQIVSQP